jgi:hypothetical protein
MWECSNCKEKIEDKYKHCWNCGKPKEGAHQDSTSVKIHLKAEPPPEEIRAENVIPRKEEIPVKEIPPEKEIPHKEEISHKEESLPFEHALLFEEKAPSKIGKIVSPILWLAAFILVAGFTYYSYQKTKAFDNQVAEDAKNLGGQTNQFVFNPKAPREKKGTIKAKVLPLNAQNKEVDGLYNYLPDDLRPANLDEVQTLLWLDCKPSEAGKYQDGSPAFQDKCNAYLVDRNTSKLIQVQDFLGELPPLDKKWGGSYASGKVLPETYISYIKSNQPENEQTPDRLASDSPNHHYWFKSELLYSSILLILLGAIGIGWIFYKIKSARWKPE